MQPQISLITVNYNSSEFIELTLYALEKLTKNSYQVFIIDNNSQIKDYKKLEKIVAKYDNVFIERNETPPKGASMAHGTSLNYLAKKVNTPYLSVLDADATWLRKNWDEIIINQMDDKVKVIGTQAPGEKPQDFPLMFTILFETKIFKELNIDFRPKDPSQLQDTGFELREKYLNAGYQGKNIELKSTRTYKNGPFKDIICAEYYLDNNYDNIFASHFGRGSNLGTPKYLKGWKKYLYRLPYLGQYLLTQKGKKEKRQWIKICKKIIDEQSAQ